MDVTNCKKKKKMAFCNDLTDDLGYFILFFLNQVSIVMAGCCIIDKEKTIPILLSLRLFIYYAVYKYIYSAPRYL